ncbi:MAG: serine phosphatase RsbU, regulator of sigma subunit [Planctomycetota bacterium]|nr:serine phosphatase RsbU, regulator of sigma subunit [Planctomycetota bacterium]
MAGLLVMNGTPSGQFVEIDLDEALIGRLPRCHIVLDPHGVSREHAKIRRDGNRFYVVDLNSRNRTKLNEKEIAPMMDHPLKEGDRINICDVEMVFCNKYPIEEPKKTDEDLVVLTDEGTDSPLHTLDASRSDQLVCAVKPEEKLRAILEISRTLSSNLKLDSVAPKILDALANIFPQAERYFLALVNPDDPKRTIRQKFHKIREGKKPGIRNLLGRAPQDETQLTISRSLLGHVLGQKKAVLSQDAGNDANLPTSASIADLKIRSVMCAPLVTPDGQALGIIQLDTSDRRQFGQEDLDVLASVASQAAIAIQNVAMHESLLARERIERDLRLAEQVQKRFLPQTTPTVAGYEFFAYYHAAYEVGGDYYDFVPLKENRLAIALGDVSGKGVAAALMMAKFSGDTRFCILTQDGPAAAAEMLNAQLCAAGIEEKFITLSLGVLDANTHVFRLTSAGHLPLFVRHADGTVDLFGHDIAGFPLGVMDDSTYTESEITLAPGDVVIIYSDGVPDSRSPADELYDKQETPRLIERVRKSPGSPEAVGKAILQEIREFSAGHRQADDITLICFGPTA